MVYLVNGKKYVLSYRELRDEWVRHCEMSDKVFRANLPSAIHLACIICWFKETNSEYCLGDEGIVHQLAHLLHTPDEPLVSIKDIRKQFKRDLKLA